MEFIPNLISYVRGVRFSNIYHSFNSIFLDTSKALIMIQLDSIVICTFYKHRGNPWMAAVPSLEMGRNFDDYPGSQQKSKCE
jgi:hypothetical protein